MNHVALHLATLGWRVSAVDLRPDALQRSVDEIAAVGAEVRGDVADLGRPDAPADVVRRAWEWAPVDGLVNAAGIYPAVPFDTLDVAVWERVQAVNVRAAVFATQALAVELAHEGIRVNAVSPGFFAVASEVNPVSPEYADAVSSTLLPGTADARFIGRAVAFLLSEEAGWTSGSTLNVDGGASAGTNALPVHWPQVTDWQLGGTS